MTLYTVTGEQLFFSRYNHCKRGFSIKQGDGGGENEGGYTSTPKRRGGDTDPYCTTTAGSVILLYIVILSYILILLYILILAYILIPAYSLILAYILILFV